METESERMRPGSWESSEEVLGDLARADAHLPQERGWVRTNGWVRMLRSRWD